MTYKEAANRIEDHMRVHFSEEYPRAQKITEALSIAVDLLRDMATLQEGGELILSKGRGKTCVDCAQTCQMMGLNVPACSSYISMTKE